MLRPLFPRRPHRLAEAASCKLSALRALPVAFGPLGVAFVGPKYIGFGFPPRMADTEECGERACLCSADVMDMHSDMTRDTGSTATETGRLRYCILGGITEGPIGLRRSRLR